MTGLTGLTLFLGSLYREEISKETFPKTGQTRHTRHGTPVTRRNGSVSAAFFWSPA